MMSTGMPDAGDMEYAQLAQKIATSGLPGVATIKSIGETGKVDAGVNKQYAIEVSIELEAGDAYDTTILQNLTDDAIGSGHYAAGKRFEVKVDPDDKSKRCSTASPTRERSLRPCRRPSLAFSSASLAAAYPPPERLVSPRWTSPCTSS